MKNVTFYLACLISLVTMQSCATVFTGTTDKVHITSHPEGAKIQINGIDMGTTPALVSLKRNQDPIVVLKKEGFRDKTFTPTKAFNAISIINLGNVLGWVIDLATGAIKEFDTKAYTLELEPAVTEKKQPIP